MIWKEIDLFDIAKDIKPEISGNEIFIDLSNVEANGHKENLYNRKIECIRLSFVWTFRNEKYIDIM